MLPIVDEIIITLHEEGKISEQEAINLLYPTSEEELRKILVPSIKRFLEEERRGEGYANN